MLDTKGVSQVHPSQEARLGRGGRELELLHQLCSLVYRGLAAYQSNEVVQEMCLTGDHPRQGFMLDMNHMNVEVV